MSLSATPPSALSRRDLTTYFKKFTEEQRAVKGDKVVALKGIGENENVLRVASFNIHFHSPYSENGQNEGDSAIESTIQKELNADVLCLQEVCHDDVANMPHTHFHLLSFIGNAICSRYPLKDKTSYVYKAIYHETRGICGATIEHPIVGPVRIYNTHLDAFDDTEQIRLKQAMQIDSFVQSDLAKYSFDGPVLLMGDFNALHHASYVKDPDHWQWILKQDASRRVQSTSMAMEVLLDGAGQWVDMFEDEPPIVTTWSMRRIDYILTRRAQGWGPTHEFLPWVHYSSTSDHLPVGLDITVSSVQSPPL